MNTIPKRYVLALISALSAAGGPVHAQTVATPPKETTAAASAESSGAAKATAATDLSEDEETVLLDPFTVTAEHEGYKADDTLAGGRIRTSLRDTPSSLSIVTKKLMDDLGVTNAQELLTYTNNTEVAGLYGNYSGVASRGVGINFGASGSAEANRLVNPGNVNRARGLTAMDGTRNFLPSDIPWDGFNISRVEISRGPNSFLFGTGSPSGIANVSTNEAGFKDKGSVEFKYGSFGSTRESLDLNKVLVEDQVALRLALLNSERQYRQDPAYNDSKRVYAAIRIDPDFLKTDSARTKIQASYEHGEVRSNNPRTLPPVDYITGYLNDGQASATGYDPWQYTMNTSIGLDPSTSLWSASGSVGNQYQWGNGPQFYYDGQTGALLRAGQATSTSPTGNGFGATSNTYNVHTQGFSGFARTMNYIATQQFHISEADAPFPGAYRGTVKYLDHTLSDPSVFNFYKKLIDGDNKKEWQDWDAYNINVIQSLFNDRLSVQGVFDRQEYSYGSEGIFANRNPTLMLDLNRYMLSGNPTWLGNATSNPNVGRPLVFGDQGSISTTSVERDNYQVTVAYNLDFNRDFNTDGLLGKILGHHNVTALGGRYERFEESRRYRMNGVDSSYHVASGNNTNARVIDNGYNWLAYVGPSMLGGTAAGANLSNLRYRLTPDAATNFIVFSKDWTAGTSVDPNDPWIYNGKDGSSTTQVQRDNPANYRGYSGITVPTIYGDSRPSVLGDSGAKSEQTITSKALMYQGHFWEDTIVPSIGYRRDTTKQRGNTASEHLDPNTRVVNFDYDITDTGVEATTSSTSYGVAIHLPMVLRKKLPEGTDVTLFYFHGKNETPKVRYALDGSQLPNETGETDDYSVQFDGLNGRLTTRLTYFKTVNKNAFASVGQPLGTFAVKALPEWTLLLHAYSMAHQATPRDSNGYYLVPSSWESWTRESWANWPYGWMNDHPVEAAAVNQAMMTTFAEAFPQSYWDNYGYNIDVEAIKRGDWSHVVKGTDYPYFSSFVGGGETIHGQYPTIDQNLESKGFELDVTYRPLRNWEITLNASRVQATQTGYGAAASRHLQNMADVFLGSPVQYAGIWGGYEGAKNMFLNDIWSSYLTQIALIGSEQPELKKYRFNLISNYSFQTGALKGFNVGGAYRWEDKAILGYGVHETEIYGATGMIADVNDPIYGETQGYLDLWAGYSRKLNDKVEMILQLNLKNVGWDDHLVTVAVQPDGTRAQRRIVGGQTFELTARFKF